MRWQRHQEMPQKEDGIEWELRENDGVVQQEEMGSQF